MFPHLLNFIAPAFSTITLPPVPVCTTPDVDRAADWLDWDGTLIPDYRDWDSLRGLKFLREILIGEGWA